MTLKVGQPAFEFDDATGRMGYKNPVTGLDTVVPDPAAVPSLQMATGAFVLDTVTNGITAFAGGGQASAVALTSGINRVTTVGTAADSVKLPTSVAGMRVVVINAAAANSMNIFPVSGEAINALSANTAIACAANKTMIFFCAVAGTWNSVLTA